MSTQTLPRGEWLAPARQALDTYRESADRIFDMVPSWETFATDKESRRIARLLHQAARARAGVVREWLFSPLWLSGIASPSDLGAEVRNVIDVDRELSEAWAELLRGQGQHAAASARQAIDLASAVIDRSEDLNTKTVEAVRASVNVTARASEEAAATSMRIAESAVKQAQTLPVEGISGVLNDVATLSHVMQRAGEDAAGSTAAAARMAASDATTSAAASPKPAKKASEAARPVKANVSRDGEKIFHLPGQASYDQLQTETVFATQSEAIEAGYRIARSPGGPSIKGNIGRDGSRIYHVRGQANYDRVDAEALFDTEEGAAAEGFRRATR